MAVQVLGPGLSHERRLLMEGPPNMAQARVA